MSIMSFIIESISRRTVTLSITLMTVVFLYMLTSTEFSRILESVGHDIANSTASSFSTHRAPLRPEEIAALVRKKTKYSNRRLLLGGIEGSHAGTSKPLASTRAVVSRHRGRIVGFSQRSRPLATNLCSNKDISIIQNEETTTGIPRYVVQIVNTCISDCAPTDIHVFCDLCTDKDISITQSRAGNSGIPLYSVQITNTCMSDCAPSDIHVNCGWFASSPPPNPSVFTRLAFNDCLVNNGKPLLQGNIIQFQYANSFMYPLSFKSAKFCRD